MLEEFFEGRMRSSVSVDPAHRLRSTGLSALGDIELDIVP